MHIKNFYKCNECIIFFYTIDSGFFDIRTISIPNNRDSTVSRRRILNRISIQTSSPLERTSTAFFAVQKFKPLHFQGTTHTQKSSPSHRLWSGIVDSCERPQRRSRKGFRVHLGGFESLSMVYLPIVILRFRTIYTCYYIGADFVIVQVLFKPSIYNKKMILDYVYSDGFVFRTSASTSNAIMHCNFALGRTSD